jgi:hypothetical protein
MIMHPRRRVSEGKIRKKYNYKKLRLEEIADEILAILSDRNQIMQKKEMESSIHL